MRVFLLLSVVLSLVNGFIRVSPITRAFPLPLPCFTDNEENPEFWNNGEVEWDFPVANKTKRAFSKIEKETIVLKEAEVLPAASASAIIQMLYREKMQFDIGFSEVMNIRENPTMHMNLTDVIMILYVLFIDISYMKTKELEKNNMYQQQSVSIMVNYIKYKKYMIPVFILISSVFTKNVKYAF
jgi:hypothetical protein